MEHLPALYKASVSGSVSIFHMGCIVHIVIELALTARSWRMMPACTKTAPIHFSYRCVVLHPALDDFCLLV